MGFAAPGRVGALLGGCAHRPADSQSCTADLTAEHRGQGFVRQGIPLMRLRGMGGGTFYSRSLGELEGFQEGTPEFARLFQDYLSQIQAHLEQRGWLPKAFTYWFDEPARKDFEFCVEGRERRH